MELEEYSNYAFWNLAKLMALQNKETEAVAAFRKAIELNPKYAPIRRDFGMLLLQMGRPGEARTQFTLARQIGP